MNNRHLIKSVTPGSIAEEMEIEAGDYLLEVNGTTIVDIFDYQLLCMDEFIDVVIEKSNGEQWELEIEKDENEELGLEFENGLMDEYRSCCNKCMFCFIDQMPPGMRETLYFKDDDSRLSFLQGNYITLTNMNENDVDRIIRYNLSPINISVHTTNPKLRCKMLNNRFAGDKLKYIDRLNAADVEMNGQVVLCKNVNDKEELERTISDLEKYIPNMRSVSIVPSGLTKFRDGLYPLELFEKEDACAVIDTIEKWQKHFYEKYGIHFIHASDEWYILAEREMPEEERYDGYLQLENGVGMIRSFIEEVKDYLDSIEGDDRVINVSTISGVLAYDTIKSSCDKINKKFPNVNVHVYKIINDYFGHSITVTGLLTGQDICSQLSGKELGDNLLLPTNTLKADENIFLDDMTLEEFEKNLQINTIIVKSSGMDFVKTIINENEYNNPKISTNSKYEL
jgi:putative radical SAM enzyme (TIGR03279 family)